MANRKDRLPGNVEGEYYVDSSCIGCELCRDTAPGHFRMNESGDTALVFRQPASQDERQVCENAKEACPVEAIGNDGA